MPLFSAFISFVASGHLGLCGCGSPAFPLKSASQVITHSYPTHEESASWRSGLKWSTCKGEWKCVLGDNLECRERDKWWVQHIQQSIPGLFPVGTLFNIILGNLGPLPLRPMGTFLTVLLALQDGQMASMRLSTLPQGCLEANNGPEPMKNQQQKPSDVCFPLFWCMWGALVPWSPSLLYLLISIFASSI